MHPLQFGASELKRLGALLPSGGVFSLALADSTGLQAFREGERWRLGALHLDGERGHVPEAAFAAVVVEDIVSLAISNMGIQFFKELANWSFASLRHLSFTDCFFERVGAPAVAALISRHRVSSLELRRCFLEEADFEKLAAVAAPLERLLISESGLRVAAGDAVGGLLRGSQIRDLTLQGRFELGAGPLASFAVHAPLRILRLTDNALLTDDVARRLCESLARRGASEPLAMLDLSAAGAGGALTDAAGEALGRLLATPAGPESLHVAGHRFTKASLVKCLGVGGRLLSADFTGNDLGGASRDGELAGAAAASCKLRTLRVGGGSGNTIFDCMGEDEEAERAPLNTLAWISGVMPSLVVLDASHANVEDGALVALANALEAARAIALEELDLSSNFITEDGVVALLGGLRSAGAKLRRLDLGVNRVADEGCEALCDALLPGAALASLQHLSLRANSIGDAAPLRAALTRCRLREIDLRENLLTDAGGEQLVAAAQRRAHGRSLLLRLGGNELCEEEWADVEVQGPGVEGAEEAVGDADPEDLAGRAGGEISVSNLNFIGPDIDCRVGAGKAILDAETGDGQATSEVVDGVADEDAGEDAWGGPALTEAAEARRGGTETPPSPSAWEREQPWDHPAMSVSREEWQECLDSLAWMESCIKK